MNKIVVMTALCAAACLPCPAQQAMVVVSHSDPDGIVEPGQTVEITTTVSWTSAYVLSFSLIKGDVRASADVGLAANPRFPYSSYGTNQVQANNPPPPPDRSWRSRSLQAMKDREHSIPWPWNVSSGIEVHRFTDPPVHARRGGVRLRARTLVPGAVVRCVADDVAADHHAPHDLRRRLADGDPGTGGRCGTHVGAGGGESPPATLGALERLQPMRGEFVGRRGPRDARTELALQSGMLIRNIDHLAPVQMDVETRT